MENKNIFIKITGLLICLSIFLSIFPMIANATTSVPGAIGHTLTGMVDGTFEGGLDSMIFVYCTPNVNGIIDYKINDNSAIFEIPSYDSSQWYFDGWRTWYNGSQLGAGVVTSNKENPKYSDELNYFEKVTSTTIFDGKYYDSGSMIVYKEDNWKGTYYLSAIFKPILTVNAGTGVSYTVSGGTSVDTNKQAVTYGSNVSINYTITDSRYKVRKISASYGTTFSESDGKVSLDGMQRPATIAIETELKPQATYTAPTAKNLTYNKQAQELVNKGTSSDGVLMYSLEENGTYSENVPTAKDVGNYTVWYYVKGDNNHNDSDKALVEVEIKIGITDIGEVTAEIPDDTTDISKVVLKRTNETIPGSLKIKDGQILKLGENEIEYIFTPNDTLYETVEGKVTVIVTDTIAPVISGVEDGKTYNTTQTITITDKNLDRVTLNEKDVTDTIVLEEDEEGIYVVVATDKSGNSSTVTVKIEKLENTDTTDPVNPGGEGTETDKFNSDKDNTEIDKPNTDSFDKEDNKPTGNNPQTSDNIMLFVIIALVSVVGIIATIKVKR